MFEYFINNVIFTKNRPHDKFSSNTCSETLEILREIKKLEKKSDKQPLSSKFKNFWWLWKFSKIFEIFQVQKSVEGADFERLEGPFFPFKVCQVLFRQISQSKLGLRKWLLSRRIFHFKHCEIKYRLSLKNYPNQSSDMIVSFELFVRF